MTEDKLWLEDVAGIAPGHMLVQTKGVGGLSEVFREFVAEWSGRWCNMTECQPPNGPRLSLSLSELSSLCMPVLFSGIVHCFKPLAAAREKLLLVDWTG